MPANGRWNLIQRLKGLFLNHNNNLKGYHTFEENLNCVLNMMLNMMINSITRLHLVDYFYKGRDLIGCGV